MESEQTMGKKEEATAAAEGTEEQIVDSRVRMQRAAVPRTIPRRAARDHPHLYFNRELSWLDFNWRVLYQAMDERHPLLERVRFLAITSSNLDEFFRKRVGGLQRQLSVHLRKPSPDGRLAEEQLEQIREAVLPFHKALIHTWREELKPKMEADIGVTIRRYEDLGPTQKERLNRYFREHIFPILTPLAVDPGHPFPFISNLSLSLAVLLRHPKHGTEHFARLKVPVNKGRWLSLREKHHYVAVEQLIAYNLHEVFRGMEVVSVHPFRITRNADIERAEEEADDLLEMISQELRERRFSKVVRMEVERAMPPRLRHLLMRELELESTDVYEVEGMLDHTDCFFFADLDFPQHTFEPWEPVVPKRLIQEGDAKEHPNMFTVIRNGDLLVHHPYESFTASVLRFIEEAADDANVLAIKMTLYRTSSDSPIMSALMRAAEKGKQVAVLVEVKARFDEQNNIEWGQMLESAGVHVTYGLVGLKTHTKVALVVREEESGLRAYCHIGTGNYNPKTARLYTDLGLFTCAPDIGGDVINLFHFLTGYAPEQNYKKLLVAPERMRTIFLENIQQEIRNQKESGNGSIKAVMNALDDLDMIRALYKASQAGVQIDLVVRGHCRLRPGIKRYSENIRIISIIGRFLEHSRIYTFHNNGNPRVYMGSADWQRRNLEDRVEAIVEVEDQVLKGRLIRAVNMFFEDHRLAWDLHPDGWWVQRQPRSEEEAMGLHDRMMRQVK